jgi:hypothetical protein
MKIQINSLAALERLIGGDNEVEIEIRKSVVENFMKKHINAIANSNVTEGIKNEIMKTLVTNPTGYRSDVTLTPKAKELFASEIDHQLRNVVKDAFIEYMTANGIDQLIQDKAAYIEQELTARVLDNRIEREVDLAIKRRLNLK